MSLRTSNTLHYATFGNSVYDSSAQVNTALPVYLADAIGDAARKHGVDPRLIVAVARRESRFNPSAVSPVGACGVMQLMPATARYLGVKNVFDARESVLIGRPEASALNRPAGRRHDDGDDETAAREPPHGV